MSYCFIWVIYVFREGSFVDPPFVPSVFWLVYPSVCDYLETSLHKLYILILFGGLAYRSAVLYFCFVFIF